MAPNIACRHSCFKMDCFDVIQKPWTLYIRHQRVDILDSDSRRCRNKTRHSLEINDGTEN